MFSILDGRSCFYQWDINQKLIVEDASITEVHFCNKTDKCSLVCEIYTEDGLRLVNVPNILLQSAWDIRVYAYKENHTKIEERFKVKERTKPADYVYTEEELKEWEKLEQLIEARAVTTTSDGGEIYNDKETNKAIAPFTTARGSNTLAGSRAFIIDTVNSKSPVYILDSTEGLAKGDIYSLETDGNYELCGEILEVNYWNITRLLDKLKNKETDYNKQQEYERIIASLDKLAESGVNTNNFVYVSNYIAPVDISIEQNYITYGEQLLRVPNKPDVGSYIMGFGAFAAGVNTAATNYAAASLGYKTEAIGKYSFAANNGNRAGYASAAFGLNTAADGRQCLTIGTNTKATGNNAIAGGTGAEALAAQALAIGENVKATNGNAVAIGQNTEASGFHSLAGGIKAKATNTGALSFGWNSEANNKFATAFGFNTKASGLYSLALGNYAEAQNESSIAAGYLTKATANNQTVLGTANAVDDNALFIVGNGNKDSGYWLKQNAFTVSKDGWATVAAVNVDNSKSIVNIDYLNKVIEQLKAELGG